MGLNMILSGGNSNTPLPPNPDPKNFKILAVSVTSRKRSICVVEVHYPACTTFEGNKILVYEAGLEAFSNPSVLDPHFTENNHLLARFPATDAGLTDALTYADWKSEQ